MKPRFAITVVFEVEPARRVEFMALIHANARDSVAKEPGCLRFDVLTPESPGTATTVFLYEVYTTRKAFDHHLESMHFIHFDEMTRDMVKSKTVQLYQAYENAKT